jgi:hypothetical protein
MSYYLLLPSFLFHIHQNFVSATFLVKVSYLTFITLSNTSYSSILSFSFWILTDFFTLFFDDNLSLSRLGDTYVCGVSSMAGFMY